MCTVFTVKKLFCCVSETSELRPKHPPKPPPKVRGKALLPTPPSGASDFPSVPRRERQLTSVNTVQSWNEFLLSTGPIRLHCEVPRVVILCSGPPPAHAIVLAKGKPQDCARDTLWAFQCSSSARLCQDFSSSSGLQASFASGCVCA